jgi:hypothetical protein
MQFLFGKRSYLRDNSNHRKLNVKELLRRYQRTPGILNFFVEWGLKLEKIQEKDKNSSLGGP